MPVRTSRVARLLLVAAAASPLACTGGSAETPRPDSAATASATVSAPPAEDLTQIDTALAPSLGVDLAKMTRRPSGMFVLDRRRGSGAAADSGGWVTVAYTSWLADGKVVDDTRKAGKPREVLLGFGRVIPAWEEGLRGMRAGGRRILVVPPALGYGAAGQPGSVPSRATLVFDIELTKVH